MNKVFIPLIIVIFISSVYGFYAMQFNNMDSDIVRSVTAYISPLLVFDTIIFCSEKELIKLKKSINVVLYFLIILGILQISGLIRILTPVLKFMVPRANSVSLVEMSGRGVTLLSSEPSRAAYEIIILYATWIYLNNFPKKLQYIFDIIIVFFIVFIIRSSEGCLLLLIYLFARYRIKFAIAMTVLFVFLIPVLRNFNNRAITVFYTILANVSFSDVYYILLNQSGFRLITLIAAYKYAIFHPLGGGVGLWKYSSVEALNETYIDPNLTYYFQGGYIPVRPISFLSSISLDMGMLGLILALYILNPIFKLLKNMKDPIFCFVILFLFSITLSGSIGEPIPWICMAICYKVYKERSGAFQIVGFSSRIA
ncbi:MAG: hypothetical protein LBG80_19540 [Bacteroidales bacterium]|nr:hypothetical protein [Bacteroidales bacterium]